MAQLSRELPYGRTHERIEREWRKCALLYLASIAGRLPGFLALAFVLAYIYEVDTRTGKAKLVPQEKPEPP